MPLRDEPAWPNQMRQRTGVLRASHVEDMNRDNRQTGQQYLSPLGGEELPGFLIEYVEFHKVMREPVIENRVLSIEPLPIQHVATAQYGMQRGGVRLSPRLEEGEVALTRAADQEVAAALQQQPAVRPKADRGIGLVHLLLNHQMLPGQMTQRYALQILVARLETRSLNVVGAGIFADQFH